MKQSLCLIFLASFAFLSGCSNQQTQAVQNPGSILYEKAFYAESVEHDFKKARYLYELSAEQGHPWSQEHLRDMRNKEHMPSQFVALKKDISYYETMPYENTPNRLNSSYLQANHADRMPNIRNAVLYPNESYQPNENITTLPEVIVTAKQIDECHAKADKKAEKYADLKSKAVISDADKVSTLTGGVTGLSCLGLVALTMGLDGGLLATGCLAVGALSGAAHNYTNSSSRPTLHCRI